MPEVDPLSLCFNAQPVSLKKGAITVADACGPTKFICSTQEVLGPWMSTSMPFCLRGKQELGVI